jgi:ABC-2 type transport system permease protein
MNTLSATTMCELRQAWRDGRVRTSLLALIALFGITWGVGWQQQIRHQSDMHAAVSADRRIWEQQGARNPHSVAHFGQYAFKPSGALSAFDPGLSPWLGNSLWMEAHYQNTAAFRPAEDRAVPTMTESLSAAFVLQYLAPLVLIFLGFALIARERERQTLKMAMANGASPAAWLGGKLLALTVLAGLLWLPAWLLVITADSPDARSRALMLTLTYGVYLVMLCAFVVAVSARARTARGALLTLLCIWVLMALVVPRAAAALAERIAPSIDAGQFWQDVRAAMRNGIDGHQSDNDREQALLKGVLDKYGVAREEDLPISFAGVALQAGENHGNEVFDHYYGELQAREARQRSVLRAASIVSPWIALRSLSAGFSGTDADHHWHFVYEAEHYRRGLQRYLNDDMTSNAKGQDFDYRADPQLWRAAPVFVYSPPAFSGIAQRYLPDVLLLLGWVFLSGCAVYVGARSLAREGALS